MIARGRLPFRGGQWIDTYNQITDPDCAGTIIAGINAKNHYYVMEEMKHETDTRQIRDDKPIVLGMLPDERRHESARRVYDPNGIAPTQNTCGGGGLETKIIEPIVLGWTRDEKGNVIDRHPVEVANAVTAAKRDNTQNYVVNPNYRIRKLTPRECFRLMGVSDADIDKIQAAGISKSQQYKMAGNSIVVNCLAAIFRQLFIGNFNKVIQTEIF